MYRLIFLLIFISCTLEAHQPKLVYHQENFLALSMNCLFDFLTEQPFP